MSKEIQVVFQPSGRRINVLPGTVILEAAARAGFIVETPCGGMGKCGKCKVQVTGNCPQTPMETSLLGEKAVAKGTRLACKARINEPLSIEIPASSLFGSGQRILEHGSGTRVAINSPVKKRFVELPHPDLDNAMSDFDRILHAVGQVEAGVELLREIPRVLRKDRFRVTAVCVGNELVGIEAGDTTRELRGVAFDIGTTTVVCTLVDLRTGNDLAVTSGVNPQTSFGDDVISRITRCREGKGTLVVLQEAVLGLVRDLIGQAIAEAGVSADSIYYAVFAGNTAMQEILCGIDPSPLGEMPFVPAFSGSIRMRASDLGLHVNSAARVFVFPQIGGFVGGDTVAGIVAAGIGPASDPVLLIDIGTNGELVLAGRHGMIAASVAAGPAFEGARIVSGMRAAPGAIEKVVIEQDLQVNVIGDVKPIGICGTGLVDAAAELLRNGVLDSTGRILGPDELPAESKWLGRHLVASGQNFDFELVPASESGTGNAICLHQKDVRELQLANGAIRAGTAILLKQAGLKPEDLHSVLVAGAFGNFIRRKNARRIGMLPAIPSDKIRYIGNASSYGAKCALLSCDEALRAEKLAAQVRHVDLSEDPEFQMEFASAMVFPEHDVDCCE